MHDVLPLIRHAGFPNIRRRGVSTVQVNLGYRCNQSCVHCHVNAGPNRTEEMSARTIDEVLDFARRAGATTLDLTGGAPELNSHFRMMVRRARAQGLTVIDRCNLTILSEPGQQGLADFLAEHQVQVTASLPCYLEENVDAQRGKGVFGRSISGLQALNALGYGDTLQLDLVFNPQGPVLPPSQVELEAQYRAFLGESFGIRFSRLLTIANMPIKRFGSTLVSKGQFDTYMKTLQSAHRHENLQSVMCRDLISIDWQGNAYDCDFNQMLGLPLQGQNAPGRTHVRDLLPAQLSGQAIVVRDHCYGCTAGQGSSCGGALSEAGQMSMARTGSEG